MNNLLTSFVKMTRELGSAVGRKSEKVSQYLMKWGSFDSCLKGTRAFLGCEYHAQIYTFLVPDEASDEAKAFSVGDRVGWSEYVPADLRRRLQEDVGAGPMVIKCVADSDVDTIFSAPFGKEGTLSFPEEAYDQNGGYTEVTVWCPGTSWILTGPKYLFRPISVN